MKDFKIKNINKETQELIGEQTVSMHNDNDAIYLQNKDFNEPVLSIDLKEQTMLLNNSTGIFNSISKEQLISIEAKSITIDNASSIVFGIEGKTGKYRISGNMLEQLPASKKEEPSVVVKFDNVLDIDLPKNFTDYITTNNNNVKINQLPHQFFEAFEPDKDKNVEKLAIADTNLELIKINDKFFVSKGSNIVPIVSADLFKKDDNQLFLGIGTSAKIGVVNGKPTAGIGFPLNEEQMQQAGKFLLGRDITPADFKSSSEQTLDYSKANKVKNKVNNLANYEIIEPKQPNQKTGEGAENTTQGTGTVKGEGDATQETGTGEGIANTTQGTGTGEGIVNTTQVTGTGEGEGDVTQGTGTGKGTANVTQGTGTGDKNKQSTETGDKNGEKAKGEEGKTHKKLSLNINSSVMLIFALALFAAFILGGGTILAIGAAMLAGVANSQGLFKVTEKQAQQGGPALGKQDNQKDNQKDKQSKVIEKIKNKIQKKTNKLNKLNKLNENPEKNANKIKKIEDKIEKLNNKLHTKQEAFNILTNTEPKYTKLNETQKTTTVDNIKQENKNIETQNKPITNALTVVLTDEEKLVKEKNISRIIPEQYTTDTKQKVAYMQEQMKNLTNYLEEQKQNNQAILSRLDEKINLPEISDQEKTNLTKRKNKIEEQIKKIEDSYKNIEKNNTEIYQVVCTNHKQIMQEKLASLLKNQSGELKKDDQEEINRLMPIVDTMIALSENIDTSIEETLKEIEETAIYQAEIDTMFPQKENTTSKGEDMSPEQ